VRVAPPVPLTVTAGGPFLRPAPTDCTGVELISKESRRWRDDRGILNRPEYTMYRPADTWPSTLNGLRALADRTRRAGLAERIGVSARTLRRLLAEQTPSAATRAKVGQALLTLQPAGVAPNLKRACRECGRALPDAAPSRRYCSTACRQRHYRSCRQTLLAPPRPGEGPPGEVRQVTLPFASPSSLRRASR
jgi:hypothetical protein